MSTTLPLSTPSLLLRHFTLDDTAKVFHMSQETGMRLWLPDQVYQDEEKARQVLQYLLAQYAPPTTPQNKPYVLGVCLKSTAELIGHVGLSPKGSQVEIGYAIEDKFQRRGYASQAVTAMVEWGRQHFGLDHILGIVSARNVASCKVLQRTGFTLLCEEEGPLHGRDEIVRTYQRYEKLTS